MRRQEHFYFFASFKLSYDIFEGDEAGLTIYMNNKHHYEAFITRRDGKKLIVFRRRIGKLVAEENIVTYSADKVRFCIEGNKENYVFHAVSPDKESIVLGSGETQYLSTEAGGCFTGNYIGIYATGNGKPSASDVLVERFIYRSQPDDQ